MKLGFLTYALDRNPKGTGRYTQQLLDSLTQIGQAPYILRSGGGVEGKDILPLRGSALLPMLMTLGQAEIGWYARKHRLDLVHDPTGTAPMVLCAAKKVVTIHDTFPLSISGFSTALDTLIFRLWLPRIIPRLDMVITISQNSKYDICEYLNMPEEKVTVIHEAADHRFRLLSEGEITPVLASHHLSKPYILYVGSLEPRKNLLRLLEAFAMVHKRMPDWQLVIVGSPNYWKSSPVARMVEQLKLNNNITFTGYVPDEDLPAIYNGAGLFCFPSLYEGFGLPVLEAMACGTPVVTSNTSSLPEVGGDAALFVDPYDVEDIASGMEKVLKDPDLAREMREKGLARAQLFSWEKTAKETVRVYNQVFGKNK